MGIEIILFAVSLGIDCMTVSMTSGAILKQYNWPLFFRMAFFFGLFQGMMTLAGWLAAFKFASAIQDYDHWIAFGLLVFIGLRMIKEGCSDGNCSFDPSRLKVILTLAVATSIDALAVGITFALIRTDGMREIKKYRM